MTRGRFITFEGGEGAGKTTQVRLLAKALRGAGVQVVETREPGGSPGAEQIRELLIHGAAERWEPLTEALLHFAARAEHLRHRVNPALAAGDWVLSDRFTESTMAYQGYGLDLGREPIERLRQLVTGGLDPDLTLILDLPVAEGLGRAAGRQDGGERYERMGRAFHERLREGFLDIARRDPGRCVVIDAGGTVEQVQDQVCAAVWQRWRAELP